MAITVKDKPELYTPAGNPVIWEFASVNYAMDFQGNVIVSPNNNLVYFEVKLYHDTSLVSTLKVYSTPDIKNGGYCNLSKILESYVSAEFKAYNTGFIDFLTKPVFSYNLVVKERNYNSNTGMIVDGTTYTSPINYVFNADLDKISFKYFKANQYVLNQTNTTPIKFLTTKPDKVKVNYQSEEALYFLNNNYIGNPFAIYKFYHKDGYQVAQHSQPLLATTVNRIYKINVSPAYLDINVLNLNFDVVDHFEVYLLNADTNVVLSEKRNFLYRDVPCHLTPINFFWDSKFGGIDSYQFYLSETNLKATQNAMKVNAFKRDSSDKLREYNDKIFNTVDKILSTSIEKTITLNTMDLSDNEARWLSSILSAKNIWMKADDGLIIPVTLATNNYNIAPKRTVQGVNMKEFTFKLSEGFDSDYRII